MTLANLYAALLYLAAGGLVTLAITLLQSVLPHRQARPSAVESPAVAPQPTPSSESTKMPINTVLEVPEPIRGLGNYWNQRAIDQMRGELKGTPTGAAVEILLWYMYHPSVRSQIAWTLIGVFGGVAVSLFVQALLRLLGLG